MLEGRVTVQIPGQDHTYEAYIEEGLLDRVAELMGALFPVSRLLMVSDTRVDRLYGQRCRRSLAEAGWEVNRVVIRPGEKTKTLAGAERIYDAAISARLDRRSPVIALGGGVVGDLAGFVAATYMRGVPLVMIPTTLLAQVDSSIGGKVAVNHRQGKNLIGVFYQPALVVADTRLLRSLSSRQILAGLAEVVKYGIACDGSFFFWLEKNLERLQQKEAAALAVAVERCVRAKAAVVVLDEKEAGFRRVLNFGHTLGHALEAATEYGYYLHGEAVHVGMIAAVELAHALGFLERDKAERMQGLLARCGCSPPPAALTVEAITAFLRQDKKRRGEELVFVLPVDYGKVVFHPLRELSPVEAVASCYLAGEGAFKV